MKYLTQSSTKIFLSTFLVIGASLISISNVFAGFPTQVSDVTAQVENKTIRLTWGESDSDDDSITKYKIYYGTESVQSEGDEYSELPIEISAIDKREHLFKDLKPNIDYFFAVTAIDSSERESTRFSLEASAKIEAEKNTATKPTEIMEETKPQEITPEVVEVPVEIETPELIEEEPETEEIIPEVIEEPTEVLQPSAPVDKKAPKSAYNIKISKNNSIATITWNKSESNDVIIQKLAYKKSNGTWKFKSFSKNDERTILNTQINTQYDVKIISIDAAGNKTESEIKSFSTSKLAKSGPASQLAIIIAIAFLALVLFTAKKRA